MAKLRGQDEQLARDIAEVQREQKDIAQGVDERIRKIEPQKVTLDGREFLADPEEKRQYDEAMAAVRKGDFAAAANALGASAALAGQRLHRIGAVLARQRAVRQARLQGGDRDVARLRRQRAGHPRAPEALLAIANCQPELKDRQGGPQDDRGAGQDVSEERSGAGRPGDGRALSAPPGRPKERCSRLADGAQR